MSRPGNSTQGDGNDPCAVGVSRRLSGSTHHRKQRILKSLAWLWPLDRQRRQLSWQPPHGVKANRNQLGPPAKTRLCHQCATLPPWDALASTWLTQDIDFASILWDLCLCNCLAVAFALAFAYNITLVPAWAPTSIWCCEPSGHEVKHGSIAAARANRTAGSWG